MTAESPRGAPSRKTQRQQILDSLLAADGEVSRVVLSRISLQYNARVLELRETGFVIISRTERKSGQVHGFFRLQRGVHGEPCRTTQPLTASPKVLNTNNALPAASTPSLFGDLGLWHNPEEAGRL